MRHLALILLPAFCLSFFSCNFGKGKSPDRNAVREHNFPSVKIGNQRWMSQNLNVSHYRNGDPIPEIKDPALWGEAGGGKCCTYRNDSSLDSAYGKLYNWYAVSDSRQLCPLGWHIPSDSEWSSLSQALGGANCSGAEIKEAGFSHWSAPNTGGSGNSGFRALPSGGREPDGSFVSRGYYAYFWNNNQNDSSSNCSFDEGCARECTLSYKGSFLLQSSTSKKRGMSVRCLQDH